MSVEDQILELGMLLGERRTLGTIAGRCSAAHAQCIRKMRESKLYVKFAPTWAAYCEKYLKMSKSTANRMIVLVETYGSVYFEVAALTGISPAEFERIHPHIHPDGIHAGGEVIALIPENAQRAIEAIAKLQEEAAAAQPEKTASTPDSQIEEIEKRAEQLCSAFYKIAKRIGDKKRVAGSIKKMQMMFYGLEVECR